MTESISQVHASLAPGASTTRRVRGQTWKYARPQNLSAAGNPAVTETDDERAAWIADDAEQERRSDV